MTTVYYNNIVTKVHFGEKGGAYVFNKQTGTKRHLDPVRVHGPNAQTLMYVFDDQRRSATFRLKLEKLASEQRQHFKDIYPWKSTFNSKSIMVVATSKTHKDGTIDILGWLTAEINKSRNEIYIKKLSSRSATNPLYKGVAYKMFIKLQHYATLNNIESPIYYLYPLNAKVALSYVRWGFQNLKKSDGRLSQNMYFSSQSIPTSLVDYLDPKRDKHEEDHVTSVLSDEKAETMAFLKRTNRFIYNDLYMAIESLIVITQDDDELEKEVDRLFNRVFLEKN